MHIYDWILGKQDFHIADAKNLIYDKLDAVYSDEKKAQGIFMLKTYMDFSASVIKKNAICVDLGGTNIRVAKVVVDSDCKVTIQNFLSEKISSSITTFELLIDKIADLIYMANNGKDNIPDVRICFSYPFVSLEDHDARVIFLSKDVNIKNAEGRIIGKSLKQILPKTFKSDIYVLNDTVSTLCYVKQLLGCSKLENSLVYGVVIGTGMNISLCKNGKEIINTEIGQLPIMTNTVLENITGGKYIVQCIKRSLGENVGLDEKDGAEKLNDIISKKNDNSKIIIKAIGKIAYITSLFICSIIEYQHIREGKDNVIICINGSVYQKLNYYKESFNATLMDFCKNNSLKLDILPAGENSNIIGAVFCG